MKSTIANNTKPLEFDYEMVWREQQHEFIVSFDGGEGIRLQDVALISIADSESDDDSSGILHENGRGVPAPNGAIDEYDASEGPFLLDFLPVACSSPKIHLASIHEKENDQSKYYYPTTPSVMKESRKAVPVVTPPTTPSTPFSCGSDSTTLGCQTSNSSQDGFQKEADILLNGPRDDSMIAFASCTTMTDRLNTSCPKTSDRNSSRLFEEEYGPIRREIPWSSGNSEATTDRASNISFAKLASTIITSQGSKKFVEPLDRISQLLESKGVGRGIASIQEIRASSTLRLFIDDFSEANFWPLLDSLYFNWNLQKLIIFRRRQSDHCRVRTQQEMDCLFRVLNRLASCLSEMHLWSFCPEDQGVLSRGLANFASLEYVQIHLETGSLSTMFAKALTSLPNLVSLEVEVSESFHLSTLLDSPSLGVLSVICSDSERFSFPDEEIVKFAKKLEANTSLHVLSLEPLISSTIALPAIMDALRRNNRTLQTFQFSSTVSPTENGDYTLQSILDCLNETALRVLWNHCNESWSVSSEMKQKVLQVLNSNKTIEQFHVFSESTDYWTEKSSIL
jgi:hypothetical protein